MRKVVPQPSAYAAEDVRQVTRYGMRWRLHPAEYFQWHQYFGFADAVLDSLRKLTRPGDNFFDVGANIGFYSAVVAQAVGPNGRVFSFEPSPKTFQRLVAHVEGNALSNVSCHEAAVGEVEQALTLHDFGGDDSGKASLRPKRGHEQAAAIPVQVFSLDSFRARNDSARVDLLKVDVEGFEPEVILGASATLRSLLPVICLEWSPNWHGGREDKATGAVELLRSIGYRCFEISSLSRSHGALFPVEWHLLDQPRNLLLVPPGSEGRLRAFDVRATR